VRTRKPAAATEAASTSQYETSSNQYIPTSSPRYGSSDVATSSRLRPRSGGAYGARTARHEGARDGPIVLDEEGTEAAASRILARPSLGRA
jgi:hypothetical protein